MGGMRGVTGHGDVLKFLGETPVPAMSGNWLECRARLMSNGARHSEPLPPDLLESEALRNWLQDDCPKLPASRYSDFFSELDAWTEYWDIYHPETEGLYYFGNEGNPGYLSRFLPSPTRGRNPVFESWKRMALFGGGTADAELLKAFKSQVQQPHVEEAVLAVDELVCRLVREHFSTSSGAIDALAYLDAMERFGKNTLPENPERFACIPEHDPRKSTSLHHTIEGHIMWFAWAAHLECVEMVSPKESQNAELWPLLMAGTAMGCSFDFAFRKRCRTRSEYLSADIEAGSRIWRRALHLSLDFKQAASEVRQLFRIREYGEDW